MKPENEFDRMAESFRQMVKDKAELPDLSEFAEWIFDKGYLEGYMEAQGNRGTK